MSSDRRSTGGDATSAPETVTAAAAAGDGLAQADEDDPQADDPWFTPGPKTAASPYSADAYTGAYPADPAGATTGNAGIDDASTRDDGHLQQTEWFMRTGREGLHPDSVTSWDEASGETPPGHHHDIRVTAAGAPPWAGESMAASATPPPWETGPWPAPGDIRSPGSRADGGADQPAAPSSKLGATAMLAGRAARVGVPLDGSGSFGAPRWPARTVAMAGLIPLVVPGLVLGFLSLRQAGSQAVRKASWLAIGASAAWAVIIIVIVASISGGSAANCGSYPTAVHQAYEKALSDLSTNAPASVQAADLGTAASLANASAASAGQIGVRTGLFAMVNDMAQARADIVARRPIPAVLRQHLAKDGTVPSGSCS